MKIEVAAKMLKSVIDAMLAVHDYGQTAGRQPCVLKVTDNGLTIESTSLGTYFCQLIEGKIFRTGICGIDAKDLSILKLRGTVALELLQSGKLKVSYGRAVVNLSTDTQAMAELDEVKRTIPKIEPAARVPSMMLKSAVEFTAFTPVMKADVNIQVKCKAKSFEYVTMDSVSFARYLNHSVGVEIRSPLEFVLSAGLMDRVLKEVAQEGHTTIGISDDGSLVRFASGDFILYHPAIDAKIYNMDDNLKRIHAEEQTCTFFTTPKELKQGIEDVKPIGKGDKSLNILLDVRQKQVALKVAAYDNTAFHKIQLTDLQVASPTVAAVKEVYFGKFVTLAPKADIRVSLHGGRFLLLDSDTGEDVKVQYSVMQSVVE